MVPDGFLNDKQMMNDLPKIPRSDNEINQKIYLEQVKMYAAIIICAYVPRPGGQKNL